MKQYSVGAPFEHIALDIMGPLPESQQGNRYILVISDYFTRWVEAFAMVDQEACTVADVLVKGFISRFGVPRQSHSDQGVQFESKLFQALCQQLGIKKTRITPYLPQSDGVVEHFNCTLADMLSKVVDNDHRNWDESLPLIMLAYRSAIHESTGESPVCMLFGRNIQLPIDLMLGKPPVEVSDPVSGVAYVDDLKDKLCEINDVARETLLQASDRQKKAYDLKKNFKNYEVGDTVYLHNPSRKKGTSAKLLSPWNEPFLVTARISDLVYQIQKSPKANVQCVHHDCLKPSHLKLDSWLTSSKDSMPS